MVESKRSPLSLEDTFGREYKIFSDGLQREAVKGRIVDMMHAAEGADTVIFVDKSARPLQIPFRGLYPIMYPEQEIPNMMFVKAGREKLNLVQDHEKELSDVEEMRKVFGDLNMDRLVAKLHSVPSGKRLIVDDISSTGLSREFMLRLMQATDPESNYEHFALVDSNLGTDKLFELIKGMNFRHRKYNPRIEDFVECLPWGSKDTGVQDAVVDGIVDPRSFFTEPTKDSHKLARATFLESELNLLTREIIDVQKPHTI